MRAELGRKRALAEREANEKAADVRKNARKDAPWIQTNIVVKVAPALFSPSLQGHLTLLERERNIYVDASVQTCTTKYTFRFTNSCLVSILLDWIQNGCS